MALFGPFLALFAGGQFSTKKWDFEGSFGGRGLKIGYGLTHGWYYDMVKGNWKKIKIARFIRTFSSKK